MYKMREVVLMLLMGETFEQLTLLLSIQFLFSLPPSFEKGSHSVVQIGLEYVV